jgi:hypothetical protein
MRGLKQTVFAAAATAALLCLPIRPAMAAGPLLFAPWALGHIIRAGVQLATLPLVLASAQQPTAPYPPTPGYYGGPAGYYARPPAYYGRPTGYYPAPQAYYRPALAYARPMPQYYAQPRGYYAPRTPYSGSYGSHFDRSGSFAYRRR